MVRERYVPTGIREVTCPCGATFTRQLGAAGRPRKWCSVCLLDRSRQAIDRINEKTTERIAEGVPAPPASENGYRQVCLSVYDDDLAEWHAKLAAMRRAGVRRASLSELVRRAIAAYQVTKDAPAPGAEEFGT